MTFRKQFMDGHNLEDLMVHLKHPWHDACVNFKVIRFDSADLLKTKIVDLLSSTRHSSGIINGSF
jgi:hypothetical protein